MDDGNIWLTLLFTIIMFGLNGMLASAEIAMMGLNEVKLKAKAEEGDKKSKMLLNMKQNPSNFLSTIQIGITLAGLLSGAFVADTLSRPLILWIANMGVEGVALSVIGTASKFLITLLLTYFMLVLGELVPKRIAMAKPEKTARAVISPINFLSKITKPLVKLLAASTNLVLRLVGIDPSAEDSPVTEDEILLIMKEGHEQGTIEESEVNFMSNLFEFTDLSADDAMTHRTEIEYLFINDKIEEVISLTSKTGLHKFPVVDDGIDDVVGILYTQDIISLYPVRDKFISDYKISDLMRPAFFVPETKSLVEIFSHMKKCNDRMAIVVDEYGGTSGVLTLMDILEEIVGDIEVIEEINATNDGNYIMEGTIDMDEVADFLGINLADLEEHDTLSGFLISQLGYIPASEEKPVIIFGGYRFVVDEMDKAVIRKVKVQKVE